ncbi:NUDIX hydrolase [Roseobacter sp. EG26]|uniref:NUDIX hydrolase n=1 Tax=Roseobacter sp. EG26 TaxID=3412477 RepID=UPI003CE5BE24
MLITEFLQKKRPELTPPPFQQRQVAALCYRNTDTGKRILLVTSRGSGRWILPKGWPIDGLEDPDAALQEAWEEAGVRTAYVRSAPVGHYDTHKKLAGGKVASIKTQVYIAQVESLADAYPEDHQRKRRWFSRDEAAQQVREPALKAILQAF